MLPDLSLGLIAALGLAPFGVWLATPAALAILIWRWSHMSAQGGVSQVFRHVMAGGIGWFALALFWIIEPFLVEPEIYGWMAPFALVLIALGGALFWAVPVTLAAWLTPQWRTRGVAIAVALALSDWLRGWIFTGFPWALIGHVWIPTPVGQTAAFGGALGLSVLTVVMAVLPTLLWRAGPVRPWAAFLPGTIAGLACLAALWAGGLARLAQPLPPDTQTVLRIVQPNVLQDRKWDPAWMDVDFRRLLDLSAAPGPHDLVIWPETAVNFLANDLPDLQTDLVTASGRVPLILGIQRQEDSRYYNSLVTLDRAGRPLRVYDKFHLVPFGEYIPWGDALSRFGISAFAAQQGHGYSAGAGPQVLQSLGGAPNFQPLICYEAIFPQHLRRLADRPGWLLQITNDAWFGALSGPWQHLAQARLRAIESGLPLIRAANTGVSAVIDARGVIRQSLTLGVAGVIDAPLPGALPLTPWMRWGNAPLLIVLMTALCGVVVMARRSLRVSRG